MHTLKATENKIKFVITTACFTIVIEVKLLQLKFVRSMERILRSAAL